MYLYTLIPLFFLDGVSSKSQALLYVIETLCDRTTQTFEIWKNIILGYQSFCN